MNEKFWDLKKSKQDNMINGSLKVFAAGGFRHASTDEIVAEAEVSKGLLFHYFYSKAGLYEFLTEYSARFALVELGSEVRKAGTLPFFDLHGKITRAQARVMRQYPYLFFSLKARPGTILPEIRETRLKHRPLYGTPRCTSKIPSLPRSMSAEDAARISRLLHLARLDTASSILSRGSFSPEKFIAAVGTEYVNFF